MFVRILMFSAVVFACSKAPDASGAPTPKPDKATSGDSSRATTIMNAQISAIQDGDEAKVVDTFSADAVVLVPAARSAHAPSASLLTSIGGMDPAGESMKTIKVDKLVAGANAGAVWWSAELTVTTSRKTRKVHVTELATSDAKWKVVAGAFAHETAAEPAADSALLSDKITTAPGALSPLAADIPKLDAALAKDTVVFGTDKGETAYGDVAAHAMLKGWSKLAFSLDGKPREMHGKDWAFAITTVNWQQPKEKVPARMSCLVIGTPTTVVAVQYTAN